LETTPFEDALLLMDRKATKRERLPSLRDLSQSLCQSNQKEPWEYDKVAYKRRNEAERFFQRIKEFRRIATRYEKLDVAFIRRLLLAFIFIVLQSQRQTRHKDK